MEKAWEYPAMNPVLIRERSEDKFERLLIDMKTAIMFSGQGTQFPGMMRDIIDQNNEAKEIFQIAQEVLNRDIYHLTMESQQEELDQTVNTQPCLLVCELAVWRVLQKLEVPYEAVFGFSLGEWAALAASGVASVQDIIRVVSRRAEVMQQAAPLGVGGMAVVLGADGESVSALCRSIGDIAPANYNCPGNISVAGTSEAIERFLIKAEEQEWMVSRLAVSIPSHCALMRPAADELAPMIQDMHMEIPGKMLVMNATGTAVDRVDSIKEGLVRQLSQPVLFQQSIENLLEAGFDTFIEIGPGKTLCGMVKRTAKRRKKKVNVFPLHSLETMETVKGLI